MGRREIKVVVSLDVIAYMIMNSYSLNMGVLNRAWPLLCFFLPIILLDYYQKCFLLFSCILPINLIVAMHKFSMNKLIYWLTCNAYL